MGFTTARSSFEPATSDKPHKCSGCGRSIPRNTPFYQKPFAAFGKPKGFTRLCNLESCWETWDEQVIDVLIAKRDDRNAFIY